MSWYHYILAAMGAAYLGVVVSIVTCRRGRCVGCWWRGTNNGKNRKQR